MHVGISDGRGRALRVRGLSTWLAGVAPGRASGCEVALALVSDRAMRALNRTYRAQDGATDVLSFPSMPGDGRVAAPRGQRPVTGRRHRAVAGRFLGDIVIARGVAARQAREAGHPLGVELRILSLHGLLHLLGYDHDRDAGRMARLERRLRRQGGLREGLIERGRRR